MPECTKYQTTQLPVSDKTRLIQRGGGVKERGRVRRVSGVLMTSICRHGDARGGGELKLTQL